MQRKMQEMLKRRIFRLSDIEYGVDVVYTGCLNCNPRFYTRYLG